jgi:hypothetical protein
MSKISSKKRSEETTGEKINNLITTYLDNIFKLPPEKNLELEIRFGTRNIYPISKMDYLNVIKSLIGQGFELVKDDLYLLRIQNELFDEKLARKKISNIRTEIEGLYNIEDYCKKNNILSLLANGHVSFTQKSYLVTSEETLYPVNQDDLNLRVSLQVENNLNESSEDIQYLTTTWNEHKKIFRYLKRARLIHKDIPIFIDLSIVKTSKKDKTFYIPQYDFQSAEVIESAEQYEIELEIDNNRIKEIPIFQSPLELLKSIKQTIKFVLCGLQQSNFPISYFKQEDLLSKYLKIIKGNEYRESFKPLPRDFIGPSSLTLQMQNIISLEVKQESDSTIANIRKGYTVTDKADGLRKLLFIDDVGDIYLINTNMNIEYTGYKTIDTELFNSILDGEHITLNKKKVPIHLFAAFDIYFLKLKDITPFPFIQDSTEKANESRLSILTSVCKKLKISTNYNVSVPFRIEPKKFYTDTVSQDIFKACNIILSNIKEGLSEYETDGLIFTPKYLAVAQNTAGISAPRFKTTWIHSFKWKPPEFNTIDFLVTVNKNSLGEPIINNIFTSGVDTLKNTQLASYQTLTLRVGFDEKKHGYINPCENIIMDKLPTDREVENSEPYKPVQFYPTNPTDYDAGICNIMLQKDKLDQLKMFTEENEIIEDYSIVEFKYVHDREKFWKWIPLRIRTDKTAELRAGLKNFGNAYHVANSNWHTIHNPILEDMITTGNNIPFQIKDDDIYYNTFKGQKNLTRGLRDFHNLYVKSLLINNVSRPGNTLIDYAVGKGGDLPKWIGAKLSFVFGIDISRDNIENRLDGACARYLNYFKSFSQMPSALFVQGNSSVNIKNGDGLFTEKGKTITNAIFGNGTKDPKILGPGVYKNFGIAQSGFNISSIQFAIHYVFESVLTLNNFLKNLAECTQLNGYFIGTSYDGNTIFKELKSKKLGESIALFENESKIWELTKQYNESVLENNSNCLGLAIDVFQTSINKTFREYIVNYDYLIRIIENYGFVPISNEEAKSFNLPSPVGLFSQLFFQMNNDIKKDRKLQNAFGKAPQMTEKERQISFLNKYFVFKKVRQVDIEAVYTEIINKTPEDDILDIEATIAAQQEIESLDAKPLPVQVVRPEIPTEPPITCGVALPEETSTKKVSKKISVKPKTKTVKESKPAELSEEPTESLKVTKSQIEEPKKNVESIETVKPEDSKEKEVTEKPKKTKIKLTVKKSRKEEE